MGGGESIAAKLSQSCVLKLNARKCSCCTLSVRSIVHRGVKSSSSASFLILVITGDSGTTRPLQTVSSDVSVLIFFLGDLGGDW